MPRKPEDPEQVTLLIEGKRYDFWSNLEINLALDNFSSVEFDAPFEPDRKEFRQIFRPFSFRPLELLVDDETILKGTLVGIDPQREANQASVHISGYALPAVIQDCTAPGKTLPHTYEKLTLRSITEALLAPFNVAVQMSGEDPVKFAKQRAKEGQKIFEFLTELAKQRGYVISNTKDGDFLYWKSVRPGNPVATIVEYEQSLVSVKAKFSAQEYYSEVTGFTPATRRRGGNRHTETNPWLLNVLRPMSFHLDDIDKGDVVAATKSKMGRMFANMAAYTVSNIPTWRTPKGELWEPNTTMKLLAPSAMVYHPSELVIRNVRLSQSASKWSSELDLVLPGAFSGEIPSSVPWDEPIEKTQPFDLDEFIAEHVTP